jgi:hypothetical protein
LNINFEDVPESYLKKSLLKTGDKVVMHTCGEAEHHDGKIWTCRTDEFKSSSGQYVIFLEGFSGHFKTGYLQRIRMEESK